ncbi:hypothetical protein CDV31_001277 [Fusarium ambrosium]|uniref:Heterokaryon incompatibility domain-containing protein n=1 Tax=Fusarium ambrosium TaxID=131363 RepID=A0A428V0A5_9HYPO|nr:hypothetical protein CDV31_001277 [Fusarium ambrosium]
MPDINAHEAFINMADLLCNQCLSLNLSVAKFRIKDNKDGERSCPDSYLEFTSGRHVLQPVVQLRDSAEKCKLCALIVYTIRDTTVPNIDGVVCHLIWEMDGRTSADPQIGHEAIRTRRLRICWRDERLKRYEAYILLVAPPKYDKSDVDYPNLLNQETQFLGRRIGSNHNKRNLIREFLRLCERHHDDRCTKRLGFENPFRETLKEPYFGVIDIENECLVPLPYSKGDDNSLCFEPYATVSYVWGDGNSRQHATRVSKIQGRRKSGGLSAVIRLLPRALRQSINLIHGLGIKYIWIDALCIVQNSSHSWNLNARAMHLIYGNSTLTICAADGDDSNTGLLALDDKHTQPQVVVNYAEGVCLMLHRPAETSIEITRWNKRAWTFQERLLSKRCLIFTEGKIFFQCRSTGMSEDVFADKFGRGWSLDLVRAPLQLLSQLKVRALWFYTHCVALYTTRDLYEPFDILAAFGGMCKLMEETMRAPLVFGLPTSHFDLAILWQPVGKSLRLEKATASDDPKYKDMRFPSWSWCGWDHQGAMYDWDMVGGCMADVRAWILNHTWVDWHIRDGYGTLRRVWDARNAKEDKSEDDRWKGYKAAENSRHGAEGADDKESYDSKESFDNNTADDDHFSSNENDRYARVDHDRHASADHDLGDSDSTESRRRRRRRQRIYELLERAPRSERGRYTQHYRDVANTFPTKRSQGLEARRTRVHVLPKTDRFGRSYIGESTLRRASPKASPEFRLTLPEDPFNVLTTETSRASLPPRSVEEFPDQPFLQFFTWRGDFHLARHDAKNQSAPNQLPNGTAKTETDPSVALSSCDICDRRGDKCGSIVVDAEWLDRKERDKKTLFEFIAISDAKQSTEEEFPDWTYYIPKERIESEWDLYFVLLVESFPEEGIYRRVALGKVFKAAFTHSEDEWKEIILG